MTPLLVLAFAVSAAPWSLDLTQSELVVKVWKTGAAAGLAHDHVVRASRWSGEVGLDEAGSPESLTLEAVVDVAALVPDEPAARKRHQVPGADVPDADREKVKANLLSAGQLDVGRFPTVAFVLQRVSRGEKGLTCTGQLTLHGVTRPLTFPVSVKSADGVVEGDARVRFKTSDFGVQPYSTALGLVRNQDEVELVVHLVARRG